MPLLVENGGICSVLLIDLIAKLQEVRKLHSIPLEALQLPVREQLPPVSPALPSAGVSRGPNLGAIMYHSWCIRT